MGYVFLGLAIIACVAGSSALTASDGMVIKKYGVLGVLTFAFSYVLLSRAILTINISIAYAVFCGVGIVLSGIISDPELIRKASKIAQVIELSDTDYVLLSEEDVEKELDKDALQAD